jgi:sulfate adenylyltransferase
MIEPHGGYLVDRVVEEKHAESVKESLSDRPSIRLDYGSYQDAINISSGRYSPLTGFLSRNDLLKVANDMTLEDGTVWPLPITLDIDSDLASELEPDRKAGLESPEGELIGFIDVDEVYRQNKEEIAQSIFGTEDRSHPGVESYLEMEDFLVGGSIKLFDEHRYNQRDLLPQESRVLFESKGWDTVVGFQTRNAPHRAHEYIQKSALEHVDGILIQPKLGDKKEGDYRDEVIIGGYDRLINDYYPDDLAVLSVFPSVMRYAGPREAVFDSIIRKNQGCTHFVIGRDHAGVGDFYGGFDAHHIFDEISDIGVEPLFFNYSFYCEMCDGMTSEKVCPHGDDSRIYPSGSKIREMIRSDEEPSEKIMRPEVANFIIETDEPFVGGNE